MNDQLMRHLDPTTGPKRILALDGGGARGLVSLGLLKQIEDVLRKRAPNPDTFRLCHYFDLIAGTSTGSIIATSLALGWTVDEVRKMYDRVCPKVFKAQARGVLKYIFGADKLETELKTVLADRKLGSDDLLTGLMICAKRIDTGSPWVLTNNPKSAYWDSESNSFLPNKDYDLWRIVRASTAAPYYFEPVRVVINDNPEFPRDEGLFVDGGVAGLNNPSWQAFLTTTLTPYGFGWQAGCDKLFIVSVGAGWWRIRYKMKEYEGATPAWQAKMALTSMIQDASTHTILACQAVSEPRKPWFINSEVKALKGQRILDHQLMTFQRYDAMIDEERIRHLPSYGGASSKAIGAILDQMREIGTANTDIMRSLYALGYAAGKPQTPGLDGIEIEDFPAIFDPAPV